MALTCPPNSPAFPYSDGHEIADEAGMTMREWYAGLAMQGMLANTAQSLLTGPGAKSRFTGLAVSAWDMAEAMVLEGQRRVAAHREDLQRAKGGCE